MKGKGKQHVQHIALLKEKFGIKYLGQDGRVTRGDTSGLFTLAKRLEGLADDQGWLELVDLIDSARRNAEDRIKYQSTGWDAPQYAQALGMIAGLEQLPAILEAVQILKMEVTERMERDVERTASQGG